MGLINISLDKNSINEIKKPNLILCNRNYRKKYTLKSDNLFSFKSDFFFNNKGEISFLYYKTCTLENGKIVKNVGYDYLDNDKVLLWKNKSYFIITDCEIIIEDDGSEYKNIIAKTCEEEFSAKLITDIGNYNNIEDDTTDVSDVNMYALYDTSDTEHSCLHIVLNKMKNWSVGYIDTQITRNKHTLNVDCEDAYSFLVDTVATSFDCIILFDTLNKTVNAYKSNNYLISKNTGIYLSRRNLIKEMSFKKEPCVTKLRVFGGEDGFSGVGNVSIADINMGSNYIINYNYVKSEWTTGLLTRFNEWQMAVNICKPNYEVACSQLIALYINGGTQQQIDAKISEISAYVNSVKIENYLTNDDLSELDNYTVEQDYSNTTYCTYDTMNRGECLSVSRELLSEASDKMNFISQPKYEIELSLLNLFSMPEFNNYSSTIELGCMMKINYSENLNEPQNTLTARLIEIKTDYEKKTIDVVLSNKDLLDKFALDKIQKQASTTNRYVNLNKSYIKNVEKTRVINGINENMNTIINNVDGLSQDIIDEIERATSIENNILNSFDNYSTTADIEAKIETSEQGILSTVSETYGTKAYIDEQNDNTNAKFANYSTTEDMNSAIEQNANEINSSVSQTYATKLSVQTLDNKFTNYSTTEDMNSAINQKANEISTSVAESYATKTSLQTVDGKFANYVKTSDYNTKVTELSTGLSAEVTARETLETNVISPYVCNTGKKCGSGVKCGYSTSITSQIIKDTNAKIELLDTKFGVELNDNVGKLQSSLTLTNTKFETQISNLQTNMSTQLEMLENQIALKVTTSNLCNELSLSTDGLNFTGNRFTWSSTNSSMSANGTLTASNVNMSGAFNSIGAYGAVSLSEGQLNLSSNGGGSTIIGNGTYSGIGVNGERVIISPNQITISDSSSISSIIGLGRAYIGNVHIDGTTSGFISLNGNLVSLDGHIHSEYAKTSELSSNHMHSQYITSIPSTSSIYADTGSAACIRFSNITAAGKDWVTLNFAPLSSSDMRLKRDIQSVNEIEDFFMELKPKSYKFKGDLDDGYTHYGLLAQEVLSNAEKFGIDANGLVREYKTREYYDEGLFTGEKAYRVDYESFISIIIAMVQKQQRLIDNFIKNKSIKDIIGTNV